MDKVKVSVVLPILINHKWQRHLTECCIKTMRDTTEVPFELVIVESKTIYFKEHEDIFITSDDNSNVVKDTNMGFDAATGEIVVHTGNDILTRPGWLEKLLECFNISDCGVATLAASDLNQKPVDIIMEGIYCPLMAFRKGWRFDEEYENTFVDSDLIMRIYKAGFRSYRNWGCRITHLLQQTDEGKFSKKTREENFNKGKNLFLKKHLGSKLMVFRALTEGHIW